MYVISDFIFVQNLTIIRKLWSLKVDNGDSPTKLHMTNKAIIYPPLLKDYGYLWGHLGVPDTVS